jgi:hypothetical protein
LGRTNNRDGGVDTVLSLASSAEEEAAAAEQEHYNHDDENSLHIHICTVGLAMTSHNAVFTPEA